MISLWKSAGVILGLWFLSRGWRPAGFLMLGIAGGMGLFVLHISRATSYLSDAPETCVNCHVMTAQYVTWQHSSHAGVTTCNDSHVPHTSLAAQYFAQSTTVPLSSLECSWVTPQGDCTIMYPMGEDTLSCRIPSRS